MGRRGGPHSARGPSVWHLRCTFTRTHTHTHTLILWPVRTQLLFIQRLLRWPWVCPCFLPIWLSIYSSSVDEWLINRAYRRRAALLQDPRGQRLLPSTCLRREVLSFMLQLSKNGGTAPQEAPDVLFFKNNSPFGSFCLYSTRHQHLHVAIASLVRCAGRE